MVDLIVFAAVFAVSYFGVGYYLRVSERNGFFAIPNERSSHTQPMPHGGGIVIVLICLVTYLGISLYLPGTFSWGYFSGALLIALVSFLDDLYSIAFPWRLLVHSIAAILVMVDVDTWHGITMLGGIKLGNWGYVLTFLWIVWMVNSYNFMDGIDGLAGLQAVIAGVGWLVLGYLLQMPAIFIFSGVIAAASLGFLIHNWNPAKIFMGDVGSAFLGFTFASLPLIARTIAIRSPDLLPIAAVLFVWFFLFDSVVTILRRAFRGEKIWQAHREHLFQRLTQSGLSHSQVTSFYGVLASVLSAMILLSVEFRNDIEIAILPVVILLTAALVTYLARRGMLA
jgi:UDP-N-acetylmuramyl pentapeptide phosphotransferase/UDP-N-acetylglucosamine-1-phosphate transferase